MEVRDVFIGSVKRGTDLGGLCDCSVLFFLCIVKLYLGYLF